MSKTLRNVLLLSISFVCMAGLALGVWSFTSQSQFADSKTISLNDEEVNEFEDEINVRMTGIYPGSSNSFALHLKGAKGDEFDISLTFVKTGADSLVKFINVEVTLGEEVVSQGTLEEYLNGKTVESSLKFTKKKKTDLVITYTMPEEVGNEAKKTMAEFDILFTAQR